MVFYLKICFPCKKSVKNRIDISNSQSDQPMTHKPIYNFPCLESMLYFYLGFLMQIFEAIALTVLCA